MRLQVFSDLHLEFGRFEPTIINADVVVLAGDIHQGTAGVKWARQYCHDCPVIYVPGNHEFYKRKPLQGGLGVWDLAFGVAGGGWIHGQ